jgi:hypothetical protein
MCSVHAAELLLYHNPVAVAMLAPHSASVLSASLKFVVQRFKAVAKLHNQVDRATSCRYQSSVQHA